MGDLDAWQHRRDPPEDDDPTYAMGDLDPARQRCERAVMNPEGRFQTYVVKEIEQLEANCR
jgi:hypothetical protein